MSAGAQQTDTTTVRLAHKILTPAPVVLVVPALMRAVPAADSTCSFLVSSLSLTWHIIIHWLLQLVTLNSGIYFQMALTAN